MKTNRDTAIEIVKIVTTKKNQDEAAMSWIVDDFMRALVTQYRDIQGGGTIIKPESGTTIKPKTSVVGA